MLSSSVCRQSESIAISLEANILVALEPRAFVPQALTVLTLLDGLVILALQQDDL
jgi:hypothetical protein